MGREVWEDQKLSFSGSKGCAGSPPLSGWMRPKLLTIHDTASRLLPLELTVGQGCPTLSARGSSL